VFVTLSAHAPATHSNVCLDYPSNRKENFTQYADKQKHQPDFIPCLFAAIAYNFSRVKRNIKKILILHLQTFK